MTKDKNVKRFVRMAVLLAPGAALFGGGCPQNIKDALISGAIDFVEGTSEEVLNRVLPIPDLVSPQT